MKKITEDQKKFSDTIGLKQGVKDRHEVKQTILDLTEKKVEDKFFHDLDRENLKVQLLSGEVIDLNELSVVSRKLNEYHPQFPSEFYKQIFRLNKWDIPDGKISEKPHVVGKWTREIIYGRFAKKVLPTLEHLNPYERIGLRKHKHHQYLNDQGLEMLKGFIQDAIDAMKQCSEWYEFRIKLFETHGVS